MVSTIALQEQVIKKKKKSFNEYLNSFDNKHLLHQCNKFYSGSLFFGGENGKEDLLFCGIDLIGCFFFKVFNPDFFND